MVLQENEFHGEVDMLSSVVIEAVEGYFERRGIGFSKDDFFKQTSIDLNQVALDAICFGADIFPDMSDQVGA